MKKHQFLLIYFSTIIAISACWQVSWTPKQSASLLRSPNKNVLQGWSKCPRGRGMLLLDMKQAKKENAMMKSFFQVWESIGGSTIDFRSADEREEERGEEKREEEEEEEEEEDPNKLSEDFVHVYNSLIKVLGNSTEVITKDGMQQVSALQIKIFAEMLLQISKEGPILSTGGKELTLPSCYVEILKMFDVLSQQAKEKGEKKLSSGMKWITKKNGLSSMINVILKDEVWRFESGRDRQLICRDIDRALSETICLIATYKNLAPDVNEDYLESIRTMLEHTPVRQRHASLLFISHLFRSSHIDIFSPPLSSTWSKMFPKTFTFSTSSARSCFPFLELPLRLFSQHDEVSPSVVDLLARLSAADPLGYTIQTLQRWAVSESFKVAIQSDNLKAKASKLKDLESEEQVLLNNNIRQNRIFEEFFASCTFDADDTRHLQAPMELIATMTSVIAMATGDDDQLLMGDELIIASNAMTCVTSLARFDEKTNQRLQRLIEDHKTSRQKGAKMWKEMMAIFEDGLQSFLSATAEEVESSSNVDVNRMKRNIKTFLRDWRQPALLFELFNIEQDDESARKLVLYVFHALLGNANLDDIRFNHPLNNQHLASLRQDVVDKWIQLSDASSSSSSSSSSSLLGTRDLEAMLMMGEDARTCMAIEPANKRTLKGLLGYLLQGNTRMLCVNPALPPSSSSSSSSHGIETRKVKWRARCVARLLLREDTQETVLFVDRPYFEGEFDKQAAEDLKQQATQLADHLGVPLHLARDSPPSDQEIASLKLPPLSEAYPYPALEFVDKAGISPYVWRDGRYGVGLVFRGELGGANIRTSLGGTAVAVGILFEGWTDCLSVVERSKDSSRLGYMKDVQLIGAAIATDVRGTQTSQRQKKRMPWELTF